MTTLTFSRIVTVEGTIHKKLCINLKENYDLGEILQTTKYSYMWCFSLLNASWRSFRFCPYTKFILKSIIVQCYCVFPYLLCLSLTVKIELT